MRVVRSSDGRILPDPEAVLPGRGGYICRNAECFEKAKKRGGFSRAFRAKINEEDTEMLSEWIKEEADDI